MEKRLKILMSAYAVDDKDVGEAHLTYHWISNIAKFADITLITMGSRIHDTCGFENHPNVTLKIARPRVRFMWTGAFDRIFKPDYFEYYLRARAIARELVNREAFDVCHHIAPHSPRYPSPLHSLGVKFFVGPIHGGLQVPPTLRAGALKSHVRRLFAGIDRFRNRHDPLLQQHFQSAHRLLISAPYVKDSLPAQYRNKCVVIPPQPPEMLSDPPAKPPSDKLRLIFVGRLIESKGIELAVKALARLKSRDDLEFNIYGSGELEGRIKQIISDEGMENRINLRGFVDHNTVLRAFHQSDVLLFPSLKEAWGLAVSEAMAAGLCVICVDRGGPGYMVDDACGLKIPPGSESLMVEELSRCIDKLLNDRRLANELGNNAKQKIEREFTWDKVLEKLKEVYLQ